jgi:hypothetical protein
LGNSFALFFSPYDHHTSALYFCITTNRRRSTSFLRESPLECFSCLARQVFQTSDSTTTSLVITPETYPIHVPHRTLQTKICLNNNTPLLTFEIAPETVPFHIPNKSIHIPISENNTQEFTIYLLLFIMDNIISLQDYLTLVKTFGRMMDNKTMDSLCLNKHGQIIQIYET